MARIRTIKPEFQNSQSMGRVSRDARLTFVQLWPQCDDAGRIRANSRMLASVLFPYDEDAPKLIDGWLGELEKESCLVRYSVGNDEYIAICHWDHQKIDHPKASSLPPPPQKKQKKTRLSPRDDDAKPREASDTSRALSSTVPEGKGSRIGALARFEDFWNCCPKKTGKGAAEKAWGKATAETAPDAIIAAMRRYSETQVGKDQAYIKTPGPWLNEKRWLDETGPPSGMGATIHVLSPEIRAAEQENLKKMGII